MTEKGVGEVVDFMPVTAGTAPTPNHRLVRLLRCVRGRLTFDVDIAPVSTMAGSRTRCG